MIETVAKNCPHKDCMFRSQVSGVPYCAYIAITRHPRGCSISDCDKYKKGKTRRVSTLGGIEFQYDDI
jgi:hypothetical protein